MNVVMVTVVMVILLLVGFVRARTQLTADNTLVTNLELGNTGINQPYAPRSGDVPILFSRVFLCF